jgi:hypothetical protein
MWQVWGKVKVHTEFWWGNMVEIDKLEDLGVGGRIILKLIEGNGWRLRLD